MSFKINLIIPCHANLRQAILLLALLFAGCSSAQASAPASPAYHIHLPNTPSDHLQDSRTPLSQHGIGTSAARVQHPVSLPYLKGKTASLSWIDGNDCQNGINAYLQSAQADPNAALVGTAWINPLDGSLISGANNCMPGSASMDNVVQLVHSYGGMAYLTVTMDTEGPGAWSYQEGAAYVAEAAQNTGYIDTLVQEVQRAGYDGVIMDLEGVDHNYLHIQQLFATFNQHMWAALRPLHKWYGIALIHKLSDRDAYYKINGFEDWSLLAHCADFIVIMAVDQSRPTPGPSVSITWLQQILAYTMQTMPDMLPRIIWELPLYGDDWHQDGNKWVFDGIIPYQTALSMIFQVAPAQIDAGASDLHDFYTPHLVYSDASGVKHAVWYLTPRGLYSIIELFWRALGSEPQFAASRLAVAFWWRTTQEPGDFWPLLDSLY